MGELVYPSTDSIIAYNRIILHFIKAKRADRPSVLSHRQIEETVLQCQELPGDVYVKAAFLLSALVQKHPFASGNRRTAFLTIKAFIEDNGKQYPIPDLPEQARILLGIREGFYTQSEIIDWIKHGKIKPFTRRRPRIS